MNFTISFWNLPLSKDDSFIGLPEAQLIHALVTVLEEGEAKKYVIEPVSEEWKQKIGIIELQRTADHHWHFLSGTVDAEEVFPRIISALEEVESTAADEAEIAE